MSRAEVFVARIWAFLVLLTIISVWIGEARAVGAASGCIVVLIAAVKARWIMLDYMEARGAPPPWRRMYEAWLAACTVLMLILAIYS